MLDSLIALGPYQWIGLCFGILYVYFAGKNNPICWIFGIVSCTSIAIEDFTKTMLIADGYLQVFYVLMAIWGVYQWRFQSNLISKSVSRLTSKQHFKLVILGLFCAILLFYLINTFTDAAHAFLDSLTTSFSIIATFLLVFRKIENWIHWIWIDIIYVYLYWDQTAPLFSVLMIIYTLLAIWGFVQWKRNI